MSDTDAETTRTFRLLAWLLSQQPGHVEIPDDLGSWAIREWEVDGVTKMDVVPLDEALPPKRQKIHPRRSDPTYPQRIDREARIGVLGPILHALNNQVAKERPRPPGDHGQTAVTPDLLDALEEAAKGAHLPPGPWVQTGWSDTGLDVDDVVYAPESESTTPVADCELNEDAACFIATVDPPTVLALVAEVRRLWEVVQRVEAVHFPVAGLHEAIVCGHWRCVGSDGDQSTWPCPSSKALRGDLTASQDPSGPEGHDDADDDGEGRPQAREGKR